MCRAFIDVNFTRALCAAAQHPAFCVRPLPCLHSATAWLLQSDVWALLAEMRAVGAPSWGYLSNKRTPTLEECRWAAAGGENSCTAKPALIALTTVSSLPAVSNKEFSALCSDASADYSSQPLLLS